MVFAAVEEEIPALHTPTPGKHTRPWGLNWSPAPGRMDGAEKHGATRKCTLGCFAEGHMPCVTWEGHSGCTMKLFPGQIQP